MTAICAILILRYRNSTPSFTKESTMANIAGQVTPAELRGWLGAGGEGVEHEYGTPWIGAEELAERQQRGDNMVIFDSQSYEEYHSNSIPGAISVPGAELVYRYNELVPSPETFVVVNCGGRTRSIIGAQSLIDAALTNRVGSLKDRTLAWHLAGLDVLAGAIGP